MTHQLLQRMSDINYYKLLRIIQYPLTLYVMCKKENWEYLIAYNLIRGCGRYLLIACNCVVVKNVRNKVRKFCKIF